MAFNNIFPNVTGQPVYANKVTSDMMERKALSYLVASCVIMLLKIDQIMLKIHLLRFPRRHLRGSLLKRNVVL